VARRIPRAGPRACQAMCIRTSRTVPSSPSCGRMVADVERGVENSSARSARFRPIRANSQFVRASRKLSRSGLKPKIAHMNSKPRHVFHRGNRSGKLGTSMSVCQVFFRDYEIHNRVREEWCQKSHRHTFTFTHTRSHTEDGVRVASPTSAHARPLAACRSVGARTTR
jgi:hypothetical protein